MTILNFNFYQQVGKAAPGGGEKIDFNLALNIPLPPGSDNSESSGNEVMQSNGNSTFDKLFLEQDVKAKTILMTAPTCQKHLLQRQLIQDRASTTSSILTKFCGNIHSIFIFKNLYGHIPEKFYKNCRVIWDLISG